MTELICIVCPKGCRLHVDEQAGYLVKGAGCERGAAYGKNELQAPVRVLTSTVRFLGEQGKRLPVKTDGAIPKNMMRKAVAALNDVTVQGPVHMGDTLEEDFLGTGVRLVAARSMQ